MNKKEIVEIYKRKKERILQEDNMNSLEKKYNKLKEDSEDLKEEIQSDMEYIESWVYENNEEFIKNVIIGEIKRGEEMLWRHTRCYISNINIMKEIKDELESRG